jgi:hypothetical protein
MGTIIKDLPILDLRGISSEAFANINLVQNVRTVVLASGNAEAFMQIPRDNVRSHLVIRPEETLAVGQIEFNDQYLAALPDNTSLVVLGHVLIDGFTAPLFIQKVRGVRVYGQVLYSHSASVSVFVSRLERLQGQLLSMPPDAQRWIGSTFLDIDLLSASRGRPVASIGTITIDPAVRAIDIIDNIPAMTQIGEIKGTEEAVCALLSICTRRLGTYSLMTPIAAPPEPAFANQGAVLHHIRGVGGGEL